MVICINFYDNFIYLRNKDVKISENNIEKTRNLTNYYINFCDY